MKIYAVSDVCAAAEGYRATWVYREYYHGSAGAVINRYEEAPYEPLPLIRNVRLMPEVFFADISLVVSEKVAGQLNHFHGVRLNPCRWEKVYDLPVDESHVWQMYNRFSVFTEEYRNWLEQQYVTPSRDLGNVRYFEVLAPRFDVVKPRRGALVEFSLPHAPGQVLPPFQTLAGLHRVYPMLKATSYYFCDEQVYRVLQPHVQEPEQFTTREIEVGE